MLSSNNRNEYLRKQEPKKQRFAIKKLTVGVASVLIGFTFMGMNVAAHADTTDTGAENQQPATDQPVTNENGAETKQEASTPNTAATNNDQKNGNEETTFTPSSSTPATADMLKQNLAQAQNQNQNQVSDWTGFVSALSDANVSQINLDQDITVNGKVNGLGGLTSEYKGTLTLTGQGIARDVTINGNGHTIHFGQYNLAFQNSNYQNTTKGWNIIFKDVKYDSEGIADTYGLTHNGEKGQQGLFNFNDVNADNQKKTTVTFDGVTAHAIDRPVISGAKNQIAAQLASKLGEYYTLNFTGDNDITADGYVGAATSDDHGNAVEAGYINFLNGTNTTINMTKTGPSAKSYGSSVIRAVQDGDATTPAVNVEQGANVTLIGGKDVKGIYAGADKLTGAIDGLVNVDGNLTEDMGAGRSTAINTGNLTVGQTGAINITTAQDNNQGLVGTLNFNGSHYGVIALGVGHLQGVYSSKKNSLIDNGSITINRTATGTLSAPLIAFGGGGVTGNYELTVNEGATLDLQDAAKQQSKDHAGMITMFGTSSNDLFNFNNPGYVNLQRVGQGVGSNLTGITGNFLHLQGNGTNQANITGTVPVSQWDEGNVSDTPSFVWSINDLKSFNGWGSNAYQFIGGQDKLLHTTKSTVIMGANQAGKDSFKFDDGTNVPGNPTYTTNSGSYAPYLNQFLNNFSWWKPQRLTFGSRVSYTSDADKYQPEVITIDGKTSQKLSDLDPKTGIKDLIQQDDTTIPLPSDAKVTWYNSATDKTAWDSKMLDENGSAMPEPTNPTGNLKTTDKSAWAKVTYGDQSVDFVNIPLNITDENQPSQTDADKNTPAGQTISVDEGHKLDNTDASNAIENKGDLTDLAATDPYTWKSAPSTDKPGDYAGVVTVHYADGTSDDVPVMVHVKSQAETNDPMGQPVNVQPGQTPNAPDGISNKDQLPSGTTYTWQGTTPDPKPGETVPAVVVVTYPDGSKDEVPTTVTNTGTPENPSQTNDASKYDPQGQQVDTTIGNVPEASKAITWPDGEPTDGAVSYEWYSTPDVYTKGVHPGIVKVTYHDGSVDYVPASVNVTNTPESQPISIPQGQTPSDDDAKNAIKNNGDLPSGTTYTWEKAPDTTQPGTTAGTVKVTYPNGVSTTVPVIVNVTPTGTTDSFNPQGQPQHYDYGQQVTDDGAANLIVPSSINPSTDKVTWVNKPDTTKPGAQLVTVQVTRTGEDGKTTTKDVPVVVYVGTAADKYTPQGQNISGKKGDQVPAASTAISNMTDLPAGTNATWAIAPDMNKVGVQPVQVEVTYPDGSVDYVSVNANITDSNSDVNKYQPEYAETDVAQGASKTVDPSWSAADGNQGNPADHNSSAKFAGTTGTPSWAKVAENGTITLAPGTDVKAGNYVVPVKVTYGDNTNETVYAPVTITGTNHNDNTVWVYGNDVQKSYTMGTFDTHKTNDGSANAMADVKAPKPSEMTYSTVKYNKQTHQYAPVSSVTYTLKGDKYVATSVTLNEGQPISNPTLEQVQQVKSNAVLEFDASQVTTTWLTAQDEYSEGKDRSANTDASNFEKKGDGSKGSGTGTSTAQSQYGDPNGDQRSTESQLSGNSRARANITLSDTAEAIFGNNAGWINVFGNFYGATTNQPLTFKQNQDISNLTQDQYRQLINVTDLGAAGWNGTNANPDAPMVLAYMPGTDNTKSFWMSWNQQPSTANVANGVQGSVRIHFSDGTWLDVPATINVVADPDAGKTDQDKSEFTQKIVYTYNGKEVAYTTIDNIAKGSNVSADQLKSAIDGNVPANYTIQTGYTYPAALTNVTATPTVIEVPLTLKSGEEFNAQGKIVYQTADGTKVADGTQIKSNKGDVLTAGLLKDYADQNVPSGYHITGYAASYTVNGDNFVIPVTVAKDEPSTPVVPTPAPGDNGDHGDHGNNNGNNGNGNGNGGNLNTNNGDQGNSNANTNTAKKALPQTGNTNNAAAVAGLGLAGLTSMLGLAGAMKRKDN